MKSRPLLLAAGLLLVAGIGWAMKRRSEKGSPFSSNPDTVPLVVLIKNVDVRPAAGHVQLILTAVFDQEAQTPLRLESPLVSLRTVNGNTVARYLGPMLPEPVLTGAEPAEIMLHYWLPLAELNAGLVLEVSGRRYPVTLPNL